MYKKLISIIFFSLLIFITAHAVLADCPDCGGNCSRSCQPDGSWQCDPHCPGGKSECSGDRCYDCQSVRCPACGNTIHNCCRERPEPTSPPPERHTICKNKQCRTVDGRGDNKCDNDQDCRDNTPRPTSTPKPPTATPRPPCGSPGQPTCPPPPPPTCVPGTPNRPNMPGCPFTPTPTCVPGTPNRPNMPGCPYTPTPTRTPTPTASPTPTNTPTPTPLQPTRIVTRPPLAAIQRSSTVPQNLYTVCLKTEPCSQAASKCTQRDGAAWRVKLSSDPIHPVKSEQNTYITECISLPGSTICTTGNPELDIKFFGRYDGRLSNYEYLYQNLGYRRYRFDKIIGNYPEVNIGSATNPVRSDKEGKIGILEWQSHTDQQLGRLFLGVNDPSEILTDGNNRTQQQSTFYFQASQQNCVMISWDPHGVVFDSVTLKPVSNALVTLLKKRDDGSFTKVETKEILGNFHNPVLTNEDGIYNFHVPSGVYKVSVQAQGYTFPSNKKSLNNYANMYFGEEIVEVDKSEERNIPLDSQNQTLLQKLLNFLSVP